MSTTRSWRWIAVRLGNRMQHHAYCREHPPAEAKPDECPFCDDRAAYQEFIAKRGTQRDRQRYQEYLVKVEESRRESSP